MPGKGGREQEKSGWGLAVEHQPAARSPLGSPGFRWRAQPRGPGGPRRSWYWSRRGPNPGELKNQLIEELTHLGIRKLNDREDERLWKRKRLECEMVVVAYSDSFIYREQFEAVVRPMEERMKAGLDPHDDDLDRLASLALFFEAAALVRALGPGALSRMRDRDIKTVARCLGIEAFGD